LVSALILGWFLRALETVAGVMFSSRAIFDKVISLAIGAIDYRAILNKKMELPTGIIW
jgi:hypothetical protein